MNRVLVSSSDKNFKKLETPIKKFLSISLRQLKKENVSVEVYFVKENEIRRLNKIFRGKSRPTNVLSFKEPVSFPHPESRCRPLGEIYLAPRYISRRGEDIFRLALHGLLHLFGYTHERPRDRMRMEKLEEKLWRK